MVQRSRTVTGLLWQLGKLYRLGVIAFIAGAVLLTLTRSGGSDTRPRPCRLEQAWQNGNVYDNEDLDIARGGAGLWIWSDRHGPLERAHFTWKRVGSELTVTSTGESRKVRFSMKRSGDTCILTFGASPLRTASREFLGR